MKHSKIHSIVPSVQGQPAFGKIILPAVGFALAIMPVARAASDTWTGASDALWSNTGNWNPSVAVPGTGDTATFNGASSNTTIDLGAGVTLGTLLFDTASAAAYTIGTGAVGSQTLTLSSGGVTVNSTVAQNELINANLGLSTSVSLTNNSTTNTLTVAGGMSASASGIKTLTVNGSGNTTIGGAITSGTGTIGITKSGSGTLTLSNAGASTIASNFQMSGGLVQITAGTINVTENSGNNTGLRGGANLTVSGGTLNLSGGSSWFPIGDTSGQTSTLTVSGGTVNVTNNFGTEVGRLGAGVLTITSGTFKNADTGNIGFALGDQSTGSGTVNLNGGTLTVNKVVQGTGTNSPSGNKFYFNGGTLSTTGVNTTNFFAATTKIDTEVRNGGGTIDTAGFNATIADDIVHSTLGGDNAIDGGITKAGVGVLTLSGTNTYTGATLVNAGTLLIASTGSLNSSSSLGVANGATLELDDGMSLNDTIVLSLVDGATMNLNFSGAETVGALSLNGNFSPAGTYTVAELAALPGAGTISFTGSGSLTVTAVPEPGVIALVTLGLGGGLMFRRRRCSRA